MGSFPALIPGWVAVFSHGLSAHLDAMGIVDQTIEDAVGDGGIADLLVPARDGELGSENSGASLVTILADFPDFAALAFIERGHGPVIDDENFDATESCQEVSQAPVGSGQGQFPQQGSSAKIESGVAVATSFLCQR